MTHTHLSTAVLLVAAATPLCAQAKPSAAIPATPPTQSVSDLPSARPAAAVTQNGTRSRITWDGAHLTIDASGEPMPDVLGRVARLTGMKITGGIPDEHLYGKYGPGTVQSVLGQLFEGLAVNMMLVNHSATEPKELIVTARTGGPTPPSVREASDTAAAQNEQEQEPVVLSSPPQFLGHRPQQANANSSNGGNSTQPAFPPLPPPPAENNSFTNNGNPPPGSTTDSTSDSTSSDQPQSPNGVKTPEQIFEELRRRAAANQSQ